MDYMQTKDKNWHHIAAVAYVNPEPSKRAFAIRPIIQYVVRRSPSHDCAASVVNAGVSRAKGGRNYLLVQEGANAVYCTLRAACTLPHAYRSYSECRADSTYRAMHRDTKR